MDDRLVVSPDVYREQRVPPGQRQTERFPVLHYGAVQRIDPARWQLELSGLVRAEKTLSYAEFMRLPSVKVRADFHCVTGWSRLDNLWEGVSAQTLLELAQPLPQARYVLVHGAGGFTTNLALDDLNQPDVLLATQHDGRELTPEHGYPLRLVVPRLYAWKSAKWVTGIEFLAAERLGFWEAGGYHPRGDPWKEERYAGRR